MTLTRTAAWASFAAASALLAACSTGPPAPSTVTTSDVTTSDTTVTETETVTATPVATTSSASRRPTPAPAPTTSASPVAVRHNTCASGSLTVRVLPGGAIRGHEIAAVSVTNAGTAACVVWGFPKVHLERAGALLGSPAVPKGTPRDVTLAPGAQAQAIITDASTCNAPLSDMIKATLPESSQTVSRPMQMRGCALQVAAFGPAQ